MRIVMAIAGAIRFVSSIIKLNNREHRRSINKNVHNLLSKVVRLWTV